MKKMIENNKIFMNLKDKEFFNSVKVDVGGYGKLINGIDVCKFGKQWIILIEVMKREYGMPKKQIDM